MKKVFGILTVSLLSFSLFFTSCDKTSDLNNNEDLSESVTLKTLEPEVEFKSDQGLFEKTIVEELVKKKRCKNEVVSGKIEFTHDGEWVATIDFGDGKCDGLASVTWLGKDGETKSKEMPLDRMFPRKGDGCHGKPGEGMKEPKKVIVEELVKSEECDEIVSGIVEMYHGDKMVARIDFGNGECDGIATKCFTNKEGEQECEDFDVSLWRDKPLHEDGPMGQDLTKVVVEEVVKSEECNEPVSGIIEFYKEDILVVTIDFGNGECDGIASKCFINKDGEEECKDFELKGHGDGIHGE